MTRTLLPKNNITWTNLVLIAAMLVMLLTPSAQAKAGPAPQEEPSQSVFLVLPMPEPESVREMPAADSPLRAKEMARKLVQRQAEPLLRELSELKSRGLIAGYTLQPENFGVAVSGVTSEALREMNRSASVAYSGDGQDAPACAVETAKSLTRQMTIDHQRIEQTAREQSQLTMLDENWIQIYQEPFSGFSNIFGFMPPSQPVRFELLRNGLLMYSETKTSESDGWFSFYPDWVSCPQSGYAFSIYPGDTVRVVSGTVVKSMKVFEMFGFADPTTDTITGKSLPGKQINVIYGIPRQDSCGNSVYFETVTTAEDGSFTHKAARDISAQGFVELQLSETTGSTLAVPVTTYNLSIEPAESRGVLVSLPPSTPYTAYHKRGGATFEQKTGTTEIDGSHYFTVSDFLRSGDIIEVTGGGVTLSMTVAGIEPTVNVNTNVISGTTGPNLRVRVQASTDFQYNFQPATCASYSWACGVTSSNASGAFSFNLNIDLQPGNSYYITTYDAHGNSISYRYYVPVIGFDVASNTVYVAWGPSPNPITVTHKTSTGEVRETYPAMVDPYWRDFSLELMNTANPGDVIEVSSTDGQKRSITVQNFPVRLRGGTATVTGSAPFAGLFAAEVRDFNPATGSYQYLCQEQTVSGNFTLTYSGKTFGGQDSVTYSLRDASGNYLLGYGNAFLFYVWKGEHELSGRTETPNTPVTVKHTHGGVVLTSIVTSSNNGYFFAGTGQPIEEGDTVEVSTADGSKSTIVVPKLTVNKDPARNVIYGQAPASSYLRASLYRVYSDYYMASSTAHAMVDAAGNYAVNTTGLLWQDHCSAVNVGDACFYPIIRHYTQAGHGVYIQGELPNGVGPDSYEDDDLWTNATPYTGAQFHTFEERNDVDWVSYTVTPEMLQQTGFAEIRLSMNNIGWFMSIRGDLFRKVGDGLSIVDVSLLFSEEDHNATVVLTEPGEYLLAVYPNPNYGNYGYCDSSFTLSILNGAVYVPTISR